MKFKASIKVPNEASHVVLYWIKKKKDKTVVMVLLGQRRSEEWDCERF